MTLRSLLRSAAAVIGSLALAAQAQVAVPPVSDNVVQLSASATVDVPQDLLSIQLQAVREGPDAAKVQGDLKVVLEAALAQARRDVRPGALDVRTAGFSVQPRYGRDQRISSWVGVASLVVEGTDIARVSETAGRLQGLNVVGSGFRLSRERREQVEQDAQAQAIARFRAKAGEVARSFGFTTYGLREVAVNAQEPGPIRPVFAMARAKADNEAADAPVPVEAGRASVVVTVSGSVQLR